MREVRLTRGYVALVDDADYESVVASGPWQAVPRKHTTYAKKGIWLGNGKGTTISLHRFITGYALVDHINGDGLDNRRSNLREATQRQNLMNRRRMGNSRQPFKGIYATAPGQWRARIRVDGRRVSLGTYPTAREAARAYEAAAFLHHGEFASVNFPREDTA